MLSQIALTKILGLPLVAYGGMFALLLIMVTGYIGHSLMKGEQKFSLKLHKNMFWVTLAVGIIHGIIGLSISLKF